MTSAIGTTLLQSPGWRECQRHEQNPGYIHGQKIRAPQERHFRREHLVCIVAVRGFTFVGKCRPRWGLKKCVSMPNPGLAPWAMQECRPCRAYIAFRFVCPQGFILGFALIPPWAKRECRPCRALSVSDTKPPIHFHAPTYPNQRMPNDRNPIRQYPFPPPTKRKSV